MKLGCIQQSYEIVVYWLCLAAVIGVAKAVAIVLALAGVMK